ncbi:MAG: DUF2520 domain-containing protein [Holophagales bacterium]|nr:DUF2520 domain-containing protein [Holophagales bacterium]
MGGNLPGSAERGSVSGLRWALVGPGRVGSSMAAWLSAAGAELTAVSGRHPPGRELPGSPPWVPLRRMGSQDLDLLLIAVSDSALGSVARELACRPQASVALHVSGHFDARILGPLARDAGAGREGSSIGSIHPLRAFPLPSKDPGDARGVAFAVDGQPEARSLATGLVEALGGEAFELDGDRRRIYHLAASLAAGGVMTVLAAVEELMAAAELPPSLLPAYLKLTRGAVDAVDAVDAVGSLDGPAGDRHRAGTRDGAEAASRPVAAAITGPAARGDHAMLKRQAEALRRVAPQLSELFEILSTETRRQARRRVPSTAPEEIRKGSASEGPKR